MSETTCELICKKQFVEEIDFASQYTQRPFYYALWYLGHYYITSKLVFHGCKHIEVDYHFISEKISEDLNLHTVFEVKIQLGEYIHHDTTKASNDSKTIDKLAGHDLFHQLECYREVVHFIFRLRLL